MATITLKAYDIGFEQAVVEDYDLPKMVKKVIDSSPSANDRFMQLNENDPLGEGDFIASVTYTAKTGLFGSIVRLKKGTANQLLLTQMEAKEIKLEEIVTENNNKVAGSVKDFSYFLLTKDQLIMTAGNPSRKAFQAYVNWLLLEKLGKEVGCKFDPKTKVSEGMTIDDVKRIDIGEAFFNDPEYTKINKVLPKLKSNILKELFGDIPALNDIDAEDFISAKVELTIKRTKKAAEEKEKILKALLKSVESEDIIIRTKDGKTVKGTIFELATKISVESTQSGFYNEHALLMEMKDFMEDIKTS